jgi:uncharacterized protein (TIGR00288 family)
MPPKPETESSLAVFIDLENLATGFRGQSKAEFDIDLVLDRLVEKGKLIVKKAYADWSRFSKYKQRFHEAAIELIEVPKRGMTGKNSADIRMVVDAMDLSYSKEHIDTFVVASGDSDFSPLVSKLKENGKRAIGIGMKDSSSNLLIETCDEFIFYEDLGANAGAPPPLPKGLRPETREAFKLLIDSVTALSRENKEVLYSSMVKDTMMRKRPSFSESAHGYRSFSELLEDATRHKILEITRDSRSGTYVVLGFPRR